MAYEFSQGDVIMTVDDRRIPIRPRIYYLVTDTPKKESRRYGLLELKERRGPLRQVHCDSHGADLYCRKTGAVKINRQQNFKGMTMARFRRLFPSLVELVMRE